MYLCILDNWKTFLNTGKDSSKSATLILGGLLWKHKHSIAAIHRIVAALSEPYNRAIEGCNELFSIHHKTPRTHVHLPKLKEWEQTSRNTTVANNRRIETDEVAHERHSAVRSCCCLWSLTQKEKEEKLKQREHIHESTSKRGVA